MEILARTLTRNGLQNDRQVRVGGYYWQSFEQATRVPPAWP